MSASEKNFSYYIDLAVEKKIKEREEKKRQEEILREQKYNVYDARDKEIWVTGRVTRNEIRKVSSF